jgi:ribonuclease BN (tRNA processing enzyme)
MHNSWLFDCGDDSQRALVREVSLGPSSSSSSSSSPSPSPSPSAAAGKGVKRKAGGGRGGGRAEPEPVASAPVRHGRISSFFVTSRFSGGALGLPGMLCIASASRVVKGAERAPVQNNSGGGNGSGSGLPPTSVSVFGPPGIANFLNEMLTLSDTYLAMPVLVHEFGYGSNSSSKGKNGIASTVAPSQRGKGAVPVPRLLSRRAKLSVATLLPDELNPFGFYDLERAPKPSTPSQQGSEGFDPLLKKTRTVDPEEADRLCVFLW